MSNNTVVGGWVRKKEHMAVHQKNTGRSLSLALSDF